MVDGVGYGRGREEGLVGTELEYDSSACREVEEADATGRECGLVYLI